MNMRTKIPILFLTLFLTAPALAQQPRIDSIAVDEDKGELVLHGNFQNSTSAIVLVDSVSLPVTFTSDTLIHATILDTGKASSGWVQIRIASIASNQKLLTYFHFRVYDQWRHLYSDGTLEYEYTDNFIHTRADVLDYANIGVHFLTPSKHSFYHIVASGGNGIRGGKYTGAHYDSTVTLSRKILYDAKNRYFQFDFWVPNIYDSTQNRIDKIVTLDANFEVIPDYGGHQPYFDCDHSGDGDCYYIRPAITDFTPPTASVPKASANSTIFQAYLSSDPIAPNADMTITLRESMKVRMVIMDILGHIVFSDERMLSAGENKLPINSSPLSSGVYICRMQAGGEVVSVRFVKE